MNTPEPCDTCDKLYYDALSKDDPSYLAECKFGLTLGNKNCDKYINYEKVDKMKSEFKYYYHCRPDFVNKTQYVYLGVEYQFDDFCGFLEHTEKVFSDREKADKWVEEFENTNFHYREIRIYEVE